MTDSLCRILTVIRVSGPTGGAGRVAAAIVANGKDVDDKGTRSLIYEEIDPRTECSLVVYT